MHIQVPGKGQSKVNLRSFDVLIGLGVCFLDGFRRDFGKRSRFWILVVVNQTLQCRRGQGPDNEKSEMARA